MGWSVGNSAHSTAGTGTTRTATLAVTAGQIIVAFAWTNSGQSACAFTYTDDAAGGGNAWAEADKLTTARPSVISIGKAIATTTATITITVTGDHTIEWLHVVAFSHDGGTIPGTVNATNKAASSSSITVTTSVANTLLVGASDSSGGNPTVGSGFTFVFGADVSTVRAMSEYETDLTNSSGSNTVSYTPATTSQGLIGVAFDPPAASGVFTKNVFARQAVKRSAFY